MTRKMTDIAIPPNESGPGGPAWLQDLAATRASYGVKPENDAMIAAWVIEASWAHPVWHSYYLSLVHLRPLPDDRETMIYLRGATHEMVLMALNPDFPLEPLIAGEKGALHFLTPANFAAQLIADSDAAAAERIRLEAVQPIVQGVLSPDTDFRAAWIARFGDNMMRKDFAL